MQAYGVYLSHYLSENLFPDATAIDFALIGGFNYSMAMLVAPFVTILARRYGIKAPLIIGVALLSAAHLSASFSTRIWQLYLSQGILLGFGVGFTYIPSIAILSQWFQKRRSLANGISGAGSGIGGLLFSFATESAITDLSLAWSFRLTAIISIIILLPSALLLRSRNEVVRPCQRGFDAGLLRRYDVQMLLAWSFVVMFGFNTLLFSLPDFARSIGLSSSQAANISALLNLGIATGRPLIGIISDRYGRIETAGVLTFICGILCFVLWLPGTSYATIILFSLLNGAVFGVFWVVSKLSVGGLTRTLIRAYWQTIGPLCVEVAGLVELPSLLSLSWITITLPTSCKKNAVHQSDPLLFSALIFLQLCLLPLSILVPLSKYDH